MIAILHTLAEGSDGLIELAIFVIIAIAGIIGSLAKKSAEKKRKEEANRAAGNRPRPSPPRPVEQPARQRTLSAAQQAAQASQSRRAKTQLYRPVPSPQPRQQGSAGQPRPVRTVTPDPLVRAAMRIAHPHQHDPDDDTVHRLVETVQSMQPKKKKPVRESPEQGRRIVANAESNDLIDLTKTKAIRQVDLTDARKVKEAFVLMEILSPPKALKDDRHSWDI
ncbi:MAG TPA: hypothetical protein ENL03_02015 [Phycisphaerae bacterium]|nr:hypothetical protein [Phycisphaerae bacterium]